MIGPSRVTAVTFDEDGWRTPSPLCWADDRGADKMPPHSMSWRGEVTAVTSSAVRRPYPNRPGDSSNG